MSRARHGLHRGLQGLWLSAVLLWATSAGALPPLEVVLEELAEFRGREGQVTFEGRIRYGPVGTVPVRVERPFGAPPTLTFAGTEVLADWSDAELDVVFRLLGAALSAPDLAQAVRDMGRSLEPVVQTLTFLGDDVIAYVVGAPLHARAARFYVERDTYRLRGMDLPMAEGVYRIELRDYRLARGWLPARVEVYRDERTLLALELEAAR